MLLCKTGKKLPFLCQDRSGYSVTYITVYSGLKVRSTLGGMGGGGQKYMLKEGGGEGSERSQGDLHRGWRG